MTCMIYIQSLAHSSTECTEAVRNEYTITNLPNRMSRLFSGALTAEHSHVAMSICARNTPSVVSKVIRTHTAKSQKRSTRLCSLFLCLSTAGGCSQCLSINHWGHITAAGFGHIFCPSPANTSLSSQVVLLS